MNKNLILVLLLGLILIAGCDNKTKLTKISNDSLPVPQIEFNPKAYVCCYTNDIIKIDGKFSEPVWQQTEWTDYFVDIEGDLKEAPYLTTRVKMLWDSTNFYFAAELEEPHIWAKLKKRDAVIYHDNDFEIFIDPNGDSHEYYELEVNAFGTEWDLFLVRPYRDGAPAINAWDIQNLQTGVTIYGTINNPSDTDSLWSLECAIPWEVLSQAAYKAAPPNENDQWRLNFSRVQWETEIIGNDYQKKKDANNNNLPEHNWVWSPQGLIAMHYPEMWGFVQFTTKQPGDVIPEFTYDPIEDLKYLLRQIYYAQKTYKMQYGTFTDNLDDLELSDIKDQIAASVTYIAASQNQFEIETVFNDGRSVSINHEGRTTITERTAE